MVELLYALDADGQLVHVDSVPNGLACGCRCPGCGAPLVAKNNGETKAPHFAHASGLACGGAHESELHLLAKDIISREKAVMLPGYGRVYDGGLMRFDEVEVEERRDLSSLQPDLCGITHGHRLWVEIRVTHAIGPEKRELIRKNGIACIEINLSQFIDRQVTRQQLKAFLTEEKDMREWTNNPTLGKRQAEESLSRRDYAKAKSAEKLQTQVNEASAYDVREKMENEKFAFLQIHQDCCIMPVRSCYACRHHSTRQALFEEARRQHLPSWVTEVLSSNLLYWTKDEVGQTVSYDQCYRVRYEHFQRLLPTSSPDIHGRPVTAREIRQNEAVIPFLLGTVPAIIASEGLKCSCCVATFSHLDGSYDIACNKPNVVNRHRKKKKQ